MKILLFYIWAIAPACVMAQSYNALLIPDSLKKNARVVVREEEEILEIRSPGKAVINKHEVYTICNERGNTFGGHVTEYDQFTSINSISEVLYDAMGKELRHAKKRDMEDRSYVAESQLMDDDRYISHDFNYRTYPYTVEYQEEEEVNGVLDFDDWMPLLASGVATQHSKYVIIAPKDYKIRYKLMNGAAPPVITEAGEKKTYTWEARNLAPRSTESRGPRWQDLVPTVLLAPSDFEAQGYKGNMSTWESYGKFISQLRVGRDVLPEDIRKKVHELTDHLKDPREKVYVLYDFLQKNTHYIGIQLGIGGLQPFPADYVATKRYGDCKALSNYMVALLKEAGITGKYVEIRAGKDQPPMVEDFPSFQSNHVICCVPMDKDTIWLECTSQTESPNFSGSFTGGRKAILIDENGGHVVRTPVYSSADNLQSRVVNAGITAEGDLDAEVNTTYTGVREELPRGLMTEVSSEYREKYLNDLFNLPTYKVEKSRYEDQNGKIPVVKEYLHVLSPGYASVSGRRLFINPNLFDKSATRLPGDSARKYDFICDVSFRDVDSIVIKIPDGYEPETVPQDINLESKFGKYHVSIKILPGKIAYYRSQEESVARFPPSDYEEIVKFYEQIYKSDHARVVLVKKQS